MKKAMIKLNGSRKKSRARAKPPAPAAAPAVTDVNARPPRPASWYYTYDAANRQDFRGWFYFPFLKPEDQQDPITRRTISERIDWLYKNVGAVSMVIDGLALEEVGTGLWPKWITANTLFNKVVTDDFHYTNHDPRVFSADANTNYYSAQFNIRRMIRLYGDCFGQLLRPAPGSVNGSANLLPGWRVDGNKDPWRDGVITNELGRAIAYNVKGDGKLIADATVPADDLLHFHDSFLPGQRRGISCLASVAKRLFRREDVLRAIANGTLARERIGWAIESQPETGGGPTLLPGGGEVSEEENPDGTKYTVQKLYGTQAHEETDIPELPDGKKLRMLESNRPGTEVTGFLDSILREVAWATKRNPEYIFFLTNLGQGTVARLILQKEREITKATREFQLVPQFTNRFNVFWLWMRIRAGVYDSVEGGVPVDWWKHKLLGDPDKSVDIGREGRLLDERFATGRMSDDDYFALGGTDREDVDEATRRMTLARVKILNGINGDAEVVKSGKTFTYEEIWPRSVSNPGQQIREAATAPATSEF